MGWTAEEYEVQFPIGTGDFSFLPNFQSGSGAHPPSYTMGTGGYLPGGKADRSPSSSAEVKNGRAITPLSHTSSWRAA
jgi:hypothetical protein